MIEAQVYWSCKDPIFTRRECCLKPQTLCVQEIDQFCGYYECHECPHYQTEEQKIVDLFAVHMKELVLQLDIYDGSIDEIDIVSLLFDQHRKPLPISDALYLCVYVMFKSYYAYLPDTKDAIRKMTTSENGQNAIDRAPWLDNFVYPDKDRFPPILEKARCLLYAKGQPVK